MPRLLRDVIDRPGITAGTFLVEFATPGIGHILAEAGCDFVFLDMEHSGFGIETLKSALRYCEAADLPVLVRVPSKAYDHVARAADMGAQGVMVPMLGNAEEARALVAAGRYPPEGRRGSAFQIAHDRYRPGPAAAKMAAANRALVLCALIETAEGVEQADAIAATPGIDMLWVGHFDLSASLGVPAAFDHPRYRAAIGTIAAAARRHNRPLGRLVTTEAEAREALADGFRHFAWGGDAWLLQKAVADGVALLRGLGDGR
jgi:2-dehydro-3-deoxyglucarate aldolase/4-hydroxy-2-oxoheptanedioate aldolase